MRAVIRCDGTVEQLEAPVPIAHLCELIGAAMLDKVLLRNMGLPLHVMLVDDAGYEIEVVELPGTTWLKPVRARKPVNLRATALYLANCRPGTTHQIVGDVVVVPNSDYE